MFQNSRLNELLKYFLAHREYTPSSKLTGHFQTLSGHFGEMSVPSMTS